MSWPVDPSAPRPAIDRSTVLAEAYPGAANDIEAMVQREGGMVCEDHPGKPAHHDDCGAPGMTRTAALGMLRVRGAGVMADLASHARALGRVGPAMELMGARQRMLDA